MPRAPIARYTERSWGIDLASCINIHLERRQRTIVRAGGEHGLSGEGGSLFPDLLLFSDRESRRILQGWELKFPETGVDDPDLLANAETKARRLGLQSFLVWNVSRADLYVREADNVFHRRHTWGPLGVAARADVPHAREQWEALALVIIDDMNDFFETGSIPPAASFESYGDRLLGDVVDECGPAVAENITRLERRNARLRAELDIWWRAARQDYPGWGKEEAIARIALCQQLGAMLFAHVVKSSFNPARRVDDIRAGISQAQVREIFQFIIAGCDFSAVFQPPFAADVMDAVTWESILAFNAVVGAMRLDEIGLASLQAVLENTVRVDGRKLVGQYATPPDLASLLALITMLDLESPVLDPCCGSGTIARAARDLKIAAGLTPDRAARQVWASDKFAYPLTLTTLALAHSEAMGQAIRVFQSDVFDLEPGLAVSLADPRTGARMVERLPAFSAVVSNLPFVRFEDAETYNRLSEDILGRHAPGLALDGRSDLYAYIILHLWSMLEDGGRLGVVISNAWLGTAWGRVFRAALLRFFRLETVVASGAGRWFANADIVTNLLVLTKRGLPGPPDLTEGVRFFATLVPLAEWRDTGAVPDLASAVLLGNQIPERLSAAIHSHAQIEVAESCGLGWNALFEDIGWLGEFQGLLRPVSEYFVINRGERRGWNPMFYPADGHTIESEYIRPALRSSRSIRGLWAEPDSEAFCCSERLAELRRRGHTNALAWIRRFQGVFNEKGTPLPDALAQAGMHWYQMKSDALADLVTSINPGERLFLARLRERAFVDQRLVRFTAREEADIPLCHALLNSTVGIYYLEAIGFGRGLGALDLNATKLAGQLHMLDPEHLDHTQRRTVRDAFSPLLARAVMNLPEELAQEDRERFDRTVLAAYGLERHYVQLRAAVLGMYRIRSAVHN